MAILIVSIVTTNKVEVAKQLLKGFNFLPTMDPDVLFKEALSIVFEEDNMFFFLGKEIISFMPVGEFLKGEDPLIAAFLKF